MSTAPAAGRHPHPGFVPPPYPYDRLDQLRALARRYPDGAVDLSVGTPGDPPPPAVVAALGSSDAERGYPTSTGSSALRGAAARWMGRRFGVDVDPGDVAACVGTKEFVGTLPWLLRLRAPERDTVLYPAVSYPTYELGASLAGCRAVGVPEAPGGGLDLSVVPDDVARRALVLWVNSPANPTGACADFAQAARWARERSVVLASDECYAEFSWDHWPPPTVLQQGTEGLLAVHSLSKRSNLAGLRVGFYTGAADLVRYLAELRKHLGLMVAGPVQAAATVAFDDDDHVELQRTRYRRRLELLGGALRAVGIEVDLPAGGFYLWVQAPDWVTDAIGVDSQGAGAPGPSSGWALATLLAERAGLVVSPGELYGPGGAGHVRIALVASDEVTAALAGRLEAGVLGARA